MGLRKGQKVRKGVLLDGGVIQQELDQKMVETGLNKKELCKKLGVCQRTIDRILRNERVMPATAKGLSDAGFTVKVKKTNIVHE